ncbi:BTAD domain-containing putative transcriptional regulator [Streptomyces sp. NPDC094143]|uniref:BTAD domain-containing putative transcriptional regulator n=1 Tax=Streptomyces sp. NPDC094143 TaxID=3155310 RepID=UPI003329500A
MPALPGADLCFRLLGPLEARRGETLLDLGPPKRRALLLRLLLAGGRAVSAERLCDDLWDGLPPSAAMSSIHAHVSRLRSVLEPGRSGTRQARVLRSVPTGYALEIAPEACDSVVFERAVHQAHRLATQGRVGEARREVERALALWQGVPLADAWRSRFAEQEAARLTELYLSGEELRTGLLLQAGEGARAVAAAEALVERDVLRETSWVLLMRALYFAGRPAEALVRFETVRNLLDADLGLEPSPLLRDTQAAILQHRVADLNPPWQQPSLTGPALPRPTPGPESAVPLVGRDVELGLLMDTLRLAASSRPAWAVVSGGSGLGKTRLVQETAAHARADGFAVQWIRCAHESQALGRCGDTDGERLFGHSDVTTLTAEGDGQPLLYIVEDVDQAAEPLLRNVRRAAVRGLSGPLAVVCTVTDNPPLRAEQLLADLARQGATRLQLAPLTCDAVHDALLLSAGGRHPKVAPSRDEAQAVLRRCGGIPFLLNEVLKLPPHQRWGSEAVVPASVRSVLKVRLARLTHPALMVLQAAAALDEDAAARDLAAITGQPLESLLEQADELLEAGLLDWTAGSAPADPGTYRFTSGLLRQTVWEETTSSRRFVLRRAAARTESAARP